MWIVRVRDRGRDLVTHQVEQVDEAQEIRAVYERLGYPAEKIIVEHRAREERQAA